MPPYDARALCGGEIDLHDVKAHRNAAPEETQPVVGTETQSAAFGVVDRTGRSAGLRRNRAFHLADDKGVILAGDDIQFAGSPPAEIAAQNAQVLRAQVRRRHEFRIGAPVTGRWRRGIRCPGAA